MSSLRRDLVWCCSRISQKLWRHNFAIPPERCLGEHATRTWTGGGKLHFRENTTWARARGRSRCVRRCDDRRLAFARRSAKAANNGADEQERGDQRPVWRRRHAARRARASPKFRFTEVSFTHHTAHVPPMVPPEGIDNSTTVVNNTLEPAALSHSYLCNGADHGCLSPMPHQIRHRPRTGRGPRRGPLPYHVELRRMGLSTASSGVPGVCCVRVQGKGQRIPERTSSAARTSLAGLQTNGVV